MIKQQLNGTKPNFLALNIRDKRPFQKTARIIRIPPLAMAPLRLKSRRRQDQGSKWARIAMAILATIGIIDTGSITFQKWGWIGTLSCPGGLNGCEEVLNSPWGSLVIGSELSIPLSLLGLLSYLSVLFMTILPFLPGLSNNKNDLSRKTWWGLFLTSCGMAAFSLILIWLMVFKIEAFCFFCFLSGFISITLLILTILGGGWDDPRELIFRGIIISLIVILCGLIWASDSNPKETNISRESQGLPPIVQNISNQNTIALAKHLTKNGIVMYSAYWCPHCHDQKELFGNEAVSELVIIECAIDGKNNQSDLCKTKGITGYPSWEFNGEIESGVQSLEELANLSEYKSPVKF